MKHFGLVPVFVTLSLFSVRAFACSCGTPRPPCEAVGQSELVFLGTVTEVKIQEGALATARMRIDTAFKGGLNDTIELYDNGMCNAPDLQIGKQYLMYTSGDPGGSVPARGCTRSRPVEDAAEDLKFLEQYRGGAVATHIDGTVRLQPHEAVDGREVDANPVPLRDVRVTLLSGATQLNATTSAAGKYSFFNLAPGEYAVHADLPGYRVAWAPGRVMLSTNGCAVANVVMETNRRVEGFVRDGAGLPMSDVLVEMVSTNQDLKSWEQPTLSSVSSETGHYTITGIPAGQYYLGVNITAAPTKDAPYPKTYYPNTPDVHSAARVSVVREPSVQELDLEIPRKLRMVTIRGKVEMADGTPPLPDDLPEVRMEASALYEEIEMAPVRTDAEGRFELELCEGIAYRAYATLRLRKPAFRRDEVHQQSRPQMHSASREFTPGKENDPIVFILNETSDEFDQLSPE